MKECDNILRILKETKLSIEKDDTSKIKELSNQTINTASLTQDPDNIAVAVVVYSIGKIFERENYKSLPGWNLFYSTTTKALENSIKNLEQNNLEKFRENFGLIRKAINKLSGKLKDYIKNVFEQAQINKASRIYEHGVSMEQTANLLGISMFELAEYAGTTGISESPEGKTIDAKSRIKLAMEMFK